MDHSLQKQDPLYLAVLEVEEWKEEFLKLFKMGEQYGTTPELNNLEVCLKEVD